jgi:hypothetical protein
MAQTVPGKPAPVADAIRDGLQVICPTGTLLLVSIDPTRGGTDGRTFTLPAELEVAVQWVVEQNRRTRNCYFTCNEARPLAKKAGKADMRLARMFWADCDPDIATHRTYGAARAHLLDVLRPRVLDTASFVIDSGNGLQAFWRLSEPMQLPDKQDAFEAVNGAIGRAYDGPSTHNVDRVMRLPGTVNYPNAAKLAKGYPEQPSMARLVFADPARVYSLDELADIASNGTPSGLDELEGGTEPPTEESEQPAPVSLRARFETFLLRSRKANRRYLGNTDGLTDTSGSAMDLSMVALLKAQGFTQDDTAALLADWPHGSIEGRTQGKRYWERCWNNATTRPQRVGPRTDPPMAGAGGLMVLDGVEVIRDNEGDLHLVVDAAERVLARTGHYYQRSGAIVRVLRDPATRGVKVAALNPPTLRAIVSGLVPWEQYDHRQRGFVRKNPTLDKIQSLHAAEDYKHLPPLLGLARQPVFREDGTLRCEPGYDPETCLYGAFQPGDFDVPDEPTRTQAMEAAKLLLDLLAEFPFERKADRSAALTGLLTAAVRPTLSAAPMFHVNAPTSSSGKSYLCHLFTAMASDQTRAPMPFPANAAECAKVLLAKLDTNPAVIEFDNLQRDLEPWDALVAALTADTWEDRLLGASKISTVSTRALFLSSGNNVVPVRDMLRRTITIVIDPQSETPAERNFRGDPVREVQNNRGRYVSAALTVVRAWICAGRPRANVRPLASFGQWSDLCRQSVLWLHMADPAERCFESLRADPDTALLAAVHDAWCGEFGAAPAMVRDLLKRAEAKQALRELLYDIAPGQRPGEIHAARLGRWFARMKGRVSNGLRFMPDTAQRSAVAWRLVPTDSDAAGE